LIGTWYAGGAQRSDTLILREDDTYKQIIHVDYVEIPDIDYESDWQAWWLDYTEDGLLIHLEGMNLCAAYSDLVDCEHAGGKDFTWGNFCGNNTTGEATLGNGDGFLIVMELPALSQPPRGIQLRLMQIQELPWSYKLKEP
jgi:hypothetical protein